ncbi:MAG: hypothetical protein IPM58_11180 [Nitrospira sp.]|nr:hypothetical protein [Nitrospira sp.]
MKFVCLNCETYMSLEKVEKPEEGSLGVFFACPSCSAKFSMVTNAGETNMMNSLGLKLSPKAAPAASMEGLQAWEETAKVLPLRSQALLRQRLLPPRPHRPRRLKRRVAVPFPPWWLRWA